ncbi:hypothetical protein LTR95_001249 [Oleoguttula sp. CCFEE 5521]
MAEPMETPVLQWSQQYTVTRAPRHRLLPGDKILLPPSALEGLLSASANAAAEFSKQSLPAFDPYNSSTYSAYKQAEAQYQDQKQQLPYPLTFRLVNPANGHAVYAGIREFSADDEEVVVSDSIAEILGVPQPSVNDRIPDDDATEKQARAQITVHVKQLPKGTFVKLRPLEAGYNPDDWKALLEQYLRQNYTTLTNKEILVVPGGKGIGGANEEFRFLVDGFKPDVDGVCIVDTDLEVDIEALNEEQARETLKRIIDKSAKAPGTDVGSSKGGDLDLFRPQEGQVLPGEYVDYELASWNKALPLKIELSAVDDGVDVDLLISPFSAHQRAKPRLEEHVFADLDDRPRKRVRLEPSNVELERAEALYVSVHAYALNEDTTNGNSTSHQQAESPRRFILQIGHPDPAAETIDSSITASEDPPNPNDIRCKNCTQWISKSSMFLHENFCLRNNILCPHGCGQVFLKSSPAYATHWHCPHDLSFGSTPVSQAKHNTLFHPQPLYCPSCATLETFPSTPALAHHRTTSCPSKLILCQFCHLTVPQEGDPDVPNAEALLSGLTVHELADGARTTECHLCDRITRLRDMATHLKSHDLDRLERPPPLPCRNALCGRTQDGCSKKGDTRAGSRMGQGSGNDLGLCSVCFGPLYVSLFDPEGKAMRRRIERRLLAQLSTGCGKTYCSNTFCASGRKNSGILPGSLGIKEAMPMIKPLLDGLGKGKDSALWFCVDEGSQRKRKLAEMLAAEGVYGFAWCAGAVEAENGELDGSRKWLSNWAPTKVEEGRR